jgi:hypothetical protein
MGSPEPGQQRDETRISGQPAAGPPAEPEAAQAAQTDPAQAQEKVEYAKTQVHQTQEQAKAKVSEVGGQVRERPVPTAALAGGIVLGLVVLWALRRK